MLHLVSYDIPSDKPGDRRRAKLARKLEGVGVRVQNSVFELDIDPLRLPQILQIIELVIDPELDNVRVYPICGTCDSKIQHLGLKALIEHDPIVVW
jgi:CRISPR-associated protein Cas2